MLKPSPYPDCLCRPDAGGRVQARSSKTEEQYRIRYAGMVRRLSRELGCPTVSIDDVIDDVVARAHDLKPASFRQYRAAILQELRDMWDGGSIPRERIEELEAKLRRIERPDEAAIGSKGRRRWRTSAGRARHLPERRLESIVHALYGEGSDEARAAAGILKHGCYVGLRPSEWPEAEIIGTVLRCRSAKFSPENDRALAATRDVPLDDYDEGDIRLLIDLLETVGRVVKQAGSPELALRRMQAVLRKVRGKGKRNRVCLYTSRHQYRANLAAAGVRREEIAVRMGHASADTNGSHYASGRKGWCSAQVRKLVPIATDLCAQVRPGARTKAKIARDQPRTRTEARRLNGVSISYP